jgi:hypothetical protein
MPNQGRARTVVGETTTSRTLTGSSTTAVMAVFLAAEANHTARSLPRSRLIQLAITQNTGTGARDVVGHSAVGGPGRPEHPARPYSAVKDRDERPTTPLAAARPSRPAAAHRRRTHFATITTTSTTDHPQNRGQSGAFYVPGIGPHLRRWAWLTHRRNELDDQRQHLTSQNCASRHFRAAASQHHPRCGAPG